MTLLLFKLLGGIGLFLLGMVLLTDGIKSFAGEALKDALLRFTGTPARAFSSGVLVTLLVQSSSATTVAVIGFVSAGLLAFPQALGVVMGASLGTTGTTWIVATLGLKVSLGLYALPLVGVGAFMKLLARGRWQAIGLALAGFGLIFIGIDTLQDGMQELSASFSTASLPVDTLRGRLLVVIIGMAMTVAMQSSTAAVATTLTALHTGTINFEQAALVVIGAAIGTTITGAMAAIGASIPARRTALAHVVFNLATGLVAVAVLPAFLLGIKAAQDHLGLDAGAMSLATFHTVFIAAGVLVFLPNVFRFSAWIERRLPDRGPVLTRHIDDSLLSLPAVALEATRRVLVETACALFELLRAALAAAGEGRSELEGKGIQQALDTTQEFAARIPPAREDESGSETRLALMHAMDHLLRLRSRTGPPDRIRRLFAEEQLHDAVGRCLAILELARSGLRGEAATTWLSHMERGAADLADLRHAERAVILSQTSAGMREPATALALLDAIRWLERVGYHAWRVCHYLAGDTKATRPPPGTEPDAF